MAKIPLKAYFREIEGLIKHGQLDEATAHCKHILQYYPKLITAYRLIAKAYLEDQRYSDAADIFQRVLSSEPDDFVSNVGMSIIREDEGNLDAAIWHMERAFEVQPYNAAIQDELRRLFQRRDNVEPHKIRLTRGALARMYSKGDLYQQAIAELRVAQTEDPQRPDLQILLARMYYLSGMLVEAVDMCSALLKKLPYCLEANRLLATILPTTERKDEANIYQQRVAALDPYIAAAPITTTSSDSVPDNTVVIDKLDYKTTLPGTQTPSQPAWAASLGVSLAGFTPAEEPLPDWMSTSDQESPLAKKEAALPASQEPVQDQSTTRLPWEAPSETSSGIPDWMSPPRKGTEETTGSKTPAVTGSLIPNWMKEAGWEPSSGPKEEPSSETIPLEKGVQPEAGIARAEIPDWLRAIAPPPGEQGQPEEEGLPWEQASSSAAGEELPDWLAGIRKEEPEKPVPPAPPPDTGPGAPKPAGKGSEEDVTIPDWLKSLGAEAPIEGVADEPGPGEEAPESASTQVWQFETPTPGIPAGPAQEIPDWLSAIEEEGAAAEGNRTEETRPTLIEPAQAVQSTSEETAAPEAAVPPAGEMAAPETVAPQAGALESPASEGLAGQPRFDLTDQDAALAWLESLAAKQGISEDQLITRPEDRTGELPGWLEETKEPEAPQEESPAPGAQTVSPKSEFAEWLPEEALPASPAETQAGAPGIEAAPATPELEEGQPVLPDWLQESILEEPAPQGAPLEEPAAALPDWLQEAMHEQTVESATSQEPAAEEGVVLPDWLKSLGEQPAGEETQAATETAPAAGEEAPGAKEFPIPDWLAELGEQPAGEETVEAPVEPPAPEIAVFETAAAQPTGAEPSATQPPSAGPGFDLTDQDAALAWLESLAARQGVAEDQLFTRPEDRAQELSAMQPEAAQAPEESPKLGDTQPITKIHPPEPEAPPEGTVPAELAPETAGIPAGPIEELKAVELPPFEAAPHEEEKPAPEEIFQPVEILPAAAEVPAEELEIQPAEAPMEAVEEIAPPPSEMPVLEQPISEPTPAEAEPELPSWIAEVAEGQPEEEEYTWMPPAIAAEAAMAETATQPELPAEVSPVQEEPTVWIPPQTKRLSRDEERPININSASLIELENLPGVGFIQAQNILAFRDASGPFERVEDLAKVPGFNPAVLDDIRQRLTTGIEEKAAAPAFEELRPEEADPDQAVLIQARNALIQENVAETVTRYSFLIKRERMLDTVIRDLYEALYHFPTDVSIWQTLGDAYMHNNQLQEALDAYIKAEELLR